MDPRVILFLIFVDRGPNAETRSVAWSANVGHHVALINDQIEVQRWDAPVSNIERYSYRSVAENLEQFHLHLEKSAPRSDLSVVAHGIRLFRSLRASLGREVGGPDALQAFLVLLASGTDDANRQTLDLHQWQINPAARNLALQVPEQTWETLRHELLSGRRVDGLKPNLDILLRHAAGVLFQEAHYEAVFAAEQQLRFSVFAPDPVMIGKEKTGVGLHFTPAPLARTLVEECLAIHERSGDKLTIFDPACGSGEFLREARRQLRLSGYSGTIQLIGWDISPAACAIARFILARDTAATDQNVGFEIHNVDALSPTQKWPLGADIIVTNPPFVSWQGMTPILRERVTQILGSLGKQRPDLATAFLWRACSTVARGAVIGSILPASFLNSSSSAPVRGELSRTATTRLVARLGSHVLFPGALVDAAFYVGKRNGTQDPPTPLYGRIIGRRQLLPLCVHFVNYVFKVVVSALSLKRDSAFMRRRSLVSARRVGLRDNTMHGVCDNACFEVTRRPLRTFFTCIRGPGLEIIQLFCWRTKSSNLFRNESSNFSDQRCLTPQYGKED